MLSAQIRLEHTYAIPGASAFDLVQIDSNEWRYVIYNKTDSISLYFLDHSLDRVITVPQVGTGVISIIARRLFDLDDKIEYLVSSGTGYYVFNEDGTQLFSCHDCIIDYDKHESIFGTSLFPSPFVCTDSGTKMIVFAADRREVYSLPGRLLKSCTSGVVSEFQGYANAQEAPFPNPSSGLLTLPYTIPGGATTGDLLIYSGSGVEMQRYAVTNQFTNLQIDPARLPSGSYYYLVRSAGKESSASRFTRIR
jgi:hypothetical protein